MRRHSRTKPCSNNIDKNRPHLSSSIVVKKLNVCVTSLIVQLSITLTVIIALNGLGGVESSRTKLLKTPCLYQRQRPNPLDCQTYFECQDGRRAVKKCPNDLYFDASELKCESRIPNSHCSDFESAPDLSNASCSSSSNQQMKPSPKGCTDYFQCNGSHWIPKRCAEDGDSRIFSQKEGICVLNEEPCKAGDLQRLVDSEKLEEVTKCHDSKKNYTKPSSLECHVYVQCIYHQENDLAAVIVHECQEGFMFDEKSLECQEATKIDCGNRKLLNTFTSEGIYLQNRVGDLNISTDPLTPESVKFLPLTLDPVEDYPQNPEPKRGLRKKRRMQTIVRETETEFFDDLGNLTAVDKKLGLNSLNGSNLNGNGTINKGNGTMTNIHPKMRVKFKETETTYDGSDEERIKKKRRKENFDGEKSKKMKLGKTIDHKSSGLLSNPVSSAYSKNMGSSFKNVAKPRKNKYREESQSRSGEDDLDDKLTSGKKENGQSEIEDEAAIRKRKLKDLLPKIVEAKMILNYQEYEAPPSNGQDFEETNRDY